MKRIVVIGNSEAGISVVESIREKDKESSISIISNEPFMVYQRSKMLDLLEGKVKERDLFLRNNDFYKNNSVDLLLEKEIDSVSLNKKKISFKDSDSVEFDELFVASSAKVKLPNVKGIKKQGVVPVDGLSEVKTIIENLPIAHTVVIVGSDVTAFELARIISSKKVEVKLFADKDSSLQPADNIEVICDNPIMEILGEGDVRAVRLTSGKVIGASLVIYTGPKEADVDFLKETDVKISNGILVDDQMRSSVPFVFAVGDAVGFLEEDSVAGGSDDYNNTEGKPMPDIVSIATDTTNSVINLAETTLNSAINEKGPDSPLGFEGTAFYLPLAYALLGLEVKTLKDSRSIIDSAKTLAEGKALENGLQVPFLDGLLSKGLAVLLSEELLAALLSENHEGYLGFVPDTVLRSLGVQLVDGRIVGIAVILGKAKDSKTAVEIVRGLQEKNIVSLLVGNKGEENIKDQLLQENVEIGLDNYIVPLGPQELSGIFAVNFAIRAALTFGGCKGGQWKETLSYMQERVPVFVLVLGKLDGLIATTGLGVLNFGFPIITDCDAPQVPKIETTKYEAILTEKDYKNIVGRCIETRGIKIKISHLPIPVLYGPAFEGERVRRENLKVEFGSKYSKAFEFLTSKQMDEVEDAKVELFGPDITDSDSAAMPLGIIVEIAARNFNKDFEPILERQLHRYLNEAQGIMHMGQRDMIWVRISNEAFQKGFKLNDIGVIIHGMLHKEFGAIVDKVQVKIYTKADEVSEHIEKAKAVFEARDERLKGMTDESVDTFYSCALCQSFAPNHICIITPERLGLCGAYSWLDAKAAYEITPTGGNQPIEKGELIDEKLGQWKNINEFVFEKSNRTISDVSMYSLLVSPQSSCGCFECIIALIPEVNGVMVVNRDYTGMTPLGMNFTQMASSVGGGVQTPGFMGVGKLYIASKKFISAEGGLPRIVWMPKELKEVLKQKIEQRAMELGLDAFYDKIADETAVSNIEELISFVNDNSHPVLNMPALL